MSDPRTDDDTFSCALILALLVAVLVIIGLVVYVVNRQMY
jgi:F0F1-type ATP synthase membrane subunit c/vacuolar-type H+-ATPase subunit K